MIPTVAATLNQVLPAVMVGLNAAACGSNLAAGNLRTGLYWVAAAVLNYCAAGFTLPRLPWSH